MDALNLLLLIAIALPFAIMVAAVVWAGNTGSVHAHAIDPDTGWSVCGIHPLKGWAAHMKALPPDVPACKACLAGVGGRKVAA